jgi:4'-phosphopantetheinyl transferase
VNQTPSIQTTPRTLTAEPATDGVVEVWWAWVDRMPSASLLSLLDAGEQARAARFRAPVDRDRFVARRVLLRRVLGNRLGVPAADIELRVTAQGRLLLDPSWGVDFSTSHDEGLAVIALATGRRVGVDVERVRDLEDALDMAATHMTRREAAGLRSLPPASRSRAFLVLWTRKEAIVKALGAGLAIPLEGIETGVPAIAGVVRPGGVPGGGTWSLVDLEGLGDTHVGSVVVEGSGIRVRSMGELGIAP